MKRAALVALVGLYGTWCGAASPDVLSTSAINVYNLSAQWVDEDGISGSLGRWKGHRLLLTMAYSQCREICVYTLQRVAELQQSAERNGQPIEVAVVSYDPRVDSPATWTIYRRHHHFTRGDWHFLTGDLQATQKFAKDLQFPFWLYDEHVVHDFQILLVGPDGRIERTLNWASRNTELFER